MFQLLSRNPVTTDSLPDSVKQNTNFSVDISGHRSALTKDPRVLQKYQDEARELARLLRSHGTVGRALRTLLYYAHKSAAPRRNQDVETLLLISTAMVLAAKKSKS